MSFQQVSPINATMVAVDKDKNSAYAFRWAINHLDNPVIIVVHVKHKNLHHNGGTNVHPPDEEDMANVFSSLRGMCNRKAVEVKEAVIDDIDIVRGLQEYAHRNLIHSIVVGASRNPLSSFKKLKGYDVPTAMLKTAPDYSSVYVISKWKIVQARSAIRQMANAPVPPKNSFVQAIPYNESENGIRTPPHHPNGMSYDRNNNNVSRRPRSAGSNQSMDHIIEITSRSRHVSMDEKDISGLMSMNLSKQDMDLSDSSGYSPISQSTREMEAEMKRLRLELKQTMDMYSSACKQAISAKNQAEQIRQWKLKEERMVEESRLSQKAALAMAAQEKLKALAAWEEAEEARRKAEQEAQKRREAEKKAKKESEEKDRVLNALARSDNRYRRYTIEEIEAATDQFSASKKIGEGGYGPVYKGKLDHTPVAIKILSPDASQGRKQFQQEVEVLCRIRHPNMVLLLGACPEYGCLVYEHMDNGSLDDRLFRRNNSPPLSWRLRFQISAEISTALLFLHQTKPEPLVHRDLKPGNILLDRNYVSKIADVAKPAMGLAHQVKRAIEKDKFSEILDPAVTDWPVEKALEFAKLALECAELSKKDRPDLATVVLPTLSRLRDFGNASHRNRVLCGVDQMHSYVDYHLSSTSPNLNSKTLSTS
ncbi:hypothetical protein TanjilG_30663 [Lupinus angustifolius]|uniref:RING-type E3 ubiquitin transferase n=1 Tax=Lupinus angustifolius TaxID=3871 RepID=A0A4P1RPQ0_LUPAN|nr:hypothetical protein TanjilG_30663 [Lupinus angustifolius]